MTKPTAIKVAGLFHHRWNVPVIAALHAAKGGARLVVLAHTLDGNRDAVRDALDALIEADIVTRNPGYGHPLRPEYLLTARGRRVAPACVRFQRVAAHVDALGIAYMKWSAPALLAIRRGHSRFNAIQRALGAITPRSLTQGLRVLCDNQLVIRTVEDDFPPRSAYALSNGGTRMANATAQIDARLT